MIDRDPLVPADPDRPAATRPPGITPPPGDPTFEALPDSVSRGLAPLMSVTTATRLSSRLISTESLPVDPVRAWLARLPDDLVPFAPVVGAPLDSRSPSEVHAITRALGCPDLFIIDASDRISSEDVIAQVAKSVGARVLVLSPDPAAADRITEHLAEAGVVRALADDENPIRPSPVVARLTSTALGTGRAERMRREAAEALSVAEAQLVPGDVIASLKDEIRELTALRDRIEPEIRAAHDGTVIARKEADLAALRRHCSESRSARVVRKTGFFAWLLGRKTTVEPDPAEHEKQIGVLAADVAALIAGRDDAIRTELLIRRAPLDAQIAELIAKRDRLEIAEQNLLAARRQVDELAVPDLVRRSLTEARIIVGTPGSLEADPVFIDSPSFTLLILDRCEELTEDDFLRLHGLASRWVLVGDVLQQSPESRGWIHNDGKPGRNGRPHGPTFVARLAHLLDREPWAREPGRLVCRLMHPVTMTGRQFLTREPLLDRPEIELRFASDGEGEPTVAEVAFPAGTTVADAKAFLFRQLGEVLLHPCGAPTWEQLGGSILVRWPAADIPACERVWIDLEPGVREKVMCSGANAFTAAIEFDPSRGWDRERAQEWIAKHYQPESAGRLATVVGRAGAQR